MFSHYFLLTVKGTLWVNMKVYLTRLGKHNYKSRWKFPPYKRQMIRKNDQGMDIQLFTNVVENQLIGKVGADHNSVLQLHKPSY